MARFVFGMNLSLDGFVDHTEFAPDAVLYQHWIDHMGALSGGIYGRRIYEIMRYWDEDQDDWGDEDRLFAARWRALPKWVVTGNAALPIGSNTTRITGDIPGALAKIKADLGGEVDISGTVLAQFVGDLGLMDEYRLYYHPVVLGRGAPFFAGIPPALKPFGAARQIGRATCLCFVPDLEKRSNPSA